MTEEITALARAVEAKAHGRIREGVRHILLLVLLAALVGSLIGGWLAAGIMAVAR
jgi:hypothetical protein